MSRKNQRTRSKLILPITALGASILFAACATLNQHAFEQITKASVAITDARAAGAETYAPETLASAKGYLEEAKQKFDINRLDEAKRLAEKAELEARLAVAEADAQFSKESLAALQQEIEALRQ